MNNKKLSITITGNETDLTTFAQFLKTVSWCCGVGASRKFEVFVDGDGSANICVDFGSTDTSKLEILNTDHEPVKVYIGE